MAPRHLWTLVAIACAAWLGWILWPSQSPDANAALDSVAAPAPALAPPAPLADAIGPLDGLSSRQRRAFVVTEAFSPLPAPGPGDWLTFHEEEPQTVADYFVSGANDPTGPRNVIYVLPVGPLPADRGPTTGELSSYAHDFFSLEARVLPPLDLDALDVTRRVHYGSPQLNAADILDHMELRLPDDAYCMIAVTWSDLYPEDSYNFVFGLARLTHRVGVFSFARLHPDFYGDVRADPSEVHRLVERRAFAVMSHEMGHMFGLGHCVFLGCTMNGSNSLEESDRQPMHLCPVCLRKLHLALGFDPEQRYEALQAQYARAGLHKEEAWVQQRRAFIAAKPDPS
ncbi:MAG: archaemetzincin [Myxococcota bacterium]